MAAVGEQDDDVVPVVAIAGGSATATIRTKWGQSWLVKQVTNNMPNAPGGSTAGLYKNGQLITPMVPDSGVAAGEPWVTITSADILQVRWTGLTVGQRGSVFYMYERMS